MKVARYLYFWITIFWLLKWQDQKKLPQKLFQAQSGVSELGVEVEKDLEST